MSVNAGGMPTGKYHGHSSPEQGRMNSEMMNDFMPEQQRTGRIVANVVNDKGRYHSRCHLKDRLPAEGRLSLKVEFFGGCQDSGHLLKRALIGF